MPSTVWHWRAVSLSPNIETIGINRMSTLTAFPAKFFCLLTFIWVCFRLSLGGSFVCGFCPAFLVWPGNPAWRKLERMNNRKYFFMRRCIKLTNRPTSFDWKHKGASFFFLRVKSSFCPFEETILCRGRGNIFVRYYHKTQFYNLVSKYLNKETTVEG